MRGKHDADHLISALSCTIEAVVVDKENTREFDRVV
jgi:hypothetical protein